MGIGRRLGASLLALLVLVAVGLFALAGTAGSAKNPNELSLGVVDLAPSEVTYGQNIAMRLTVTNDSVNPWNKVVVLDPSPTTTVPDGADPDTLPDTLRSTLKKLVCPGTTTNVAGSTDDVSCDLGTLEPDGVRTLIFVWQTPAAGTAADCPPGVSACIENVVTVAGNEGAADANPSEHDDTFTGAITTTLLDTPGADKLKAGTYALEACTTPAAPTLSTNAIVGPDNQLATSVCAPQVNGLADNPGLQAYIAEESDPNAPGQTQVSQICLPAATSSCFDADGVFDPDYTPKVFDDFATFEFTLTNKSYKGTLDEVYYDAEGDGSFVLLDFDAGDPAHIVSITVDNSEKTTKVVVESLQNGEWTFG
jgi:hypothetical protein